MPATIETIRQRMAKVAEMLKRGTPGEKKAAQARLQEMLRHYGLTIEEVTTEKKDLCHFRYYRRNMRDLLVHLTWVVTGSYETFIMKCARCALDIELTKAQEQELRAFWKTFAPLYKKERKRLEWQIFIAFLAQHGLEPPPPRERKTGSTRLTDEEIAQIRGIMCGMTGPVAHPRRQLK